MVFAGNVGGAWSGVMGGVPSPAAARARHSRDGAGNFVWIGSRYRESMGEHAGASGSKREQAADVTRATNSSFFARSAAMRSGGDQVAAVKDYARPAQAVAGIV